MPVQVSYPGVYIEEMPSGVRTITGVATSITAFVGRARKGPVNVPTRIQSATDYGRRFGGLDRESPMSYAVQHYFQHGGRDAIIVRVFNGNEADNTATVTLPRQAGGSLLLRAASPGIWGNNLRVSVRHPVPDDPDGELFNLIIEEVERASGNVVSVERFLNLSVTPDSLRFVRDLLIEESSLVRFIESQNPPGGRPDPTEDDQGNPEPVAGVEGEDGSAITDEIIAGSTADTNDTGIFALRRVDLFNLLCIPPLGRGDEADVSSDTLARAAEFCKVERAMLVIDPPAEWNTVDDAESGINDIRQAVGLDAATNAALYFPRLRMANPLRENRLEEFVPCGAVAGIMARTDAQRGVWKAPAGIEASFSGVRELVYKLTDDENGRLNPLGVNCLRTFPVFGNVSWGARTLAGADQLASEWKYVPVRRLALFIEESLYRGTQWAVFEPNDEPLWAELRLNIGAFMQNLFRQGAFQGQTPKEAYFVKCDKETTTQNDINLGIVNVLVGFAPLKPAEFVVVQIQQRAERG